MVRRVEASIGDGGEADDGAVTLGGGLNAAALTVKSFSALARAWTATDR